MPNPSAQIGPPRTQYPGSCLDEFWNQGRSLFLWATCSSPQSSSQLKSYLLMFRLHLLCLRLCPLPLVLSLKPQNEPGSFFLFPSFRYLYALIRSPLSLVRNIWSWSDFIEMICLISAFACCAKQQGKGILKSLLKINNLN